MAEPPESPGDDRPRVVLLPSPREREASIQSFAMLIFACFWGLFFLGLMMAYAVIRSSAPRWPPEGAPRPPLALGALATSALVLASGALHLGLRRLAAGRRARAVEAMGAGLGLGGVFVAVQAAVGAGLWARGLTPDAGAYADLLLVLTGFHALWLLFAECACFWVLARTWRGLLNPAHHQPARLWTLFWHAATSAWLVSFVALYAA